MQKIALFASLTGIFHIHAMDVNTKIGKIIKLAQHENHYSSRTVGDKSYRPEILVMHYTAETLDRTIELFTGNKTPVSAHYVICEEGNIFQNIEEQHAAHHAGLSYWRSITGMPEGSRTGAMNLSSLGIEHVNMGYEQLEGIRRWYPFDERQIQTSIKLAQRLVQKYDIKPEDVVAHGDIAPKRKVDPGPLFPWDKFAKNCVGAWPDDDVEYILDCFLDAEEKQDDDKNAMTNWTIQHLHHWGYKLPDDQDMNKKPEERASAQDIVKAFQMHFRPSKIDGAVDPETATILKTLLCQYKDAFTQCPCEKYE
jgi:N-acetylmuramoyl-L-alanine amidase